MKKLTIFFALVLIFAFGTISVYGETTETPTTTFLTQTSAISETNEDKIYYYNDYQDLIDQVYQDVYDDIYEELYNEIIDDINSQFYEDIYQSVTNKVNEMLENTEFSVYVDEFQQQLFDVIEIADSSVLGVVSYLGTEAKGVGSGVVYRYDEQSENYYLITNHHVVKEGNNFSVAFSDSSEYVANLIGYDTEVDIAILQFKAPDKPNITLSNLSTSDDLTKGIFVLSSGNPSGLNFYGSVTLGIIGGLERKIDDNEYIDYIQHDSAINPGNSGGPIYNLNGEVIGINVSKLADTSIEGMGFAIPIDLVKRVIERIENGTLTVNTIMPRLGALYYEVQNYYNNGQVSVKNLIINGARRTDAITLDLPSGIDYGLLVYDIITLQTLYNTPIKSGDLIYRINDVLIEDEAAYYEYIYNNFEAGDTVTIYYYELDDINLEYNPIPQNYEVTFS
jgi:serine protease Do